MTPIDQLALEAAKALSEKWSVGKFTHFCDDAPDFDSAEIQELAELLAPFLRRAVELKDQPREYEVEYDKFIASMVPHCHCAERNRPCDGVLAGGLCDNQQDEQDDERATD
jgi:hypothetical protein